MFRVAELVGRAVVDRDGRRGRLSDLAVDPRGGDHPPVTDLLVKTDGSTSVVRWPDVLGAEKEVHVARLGTEPPPTEEQLARLVLLKRDVMDALVLDLEQERAVRANDVWLQPVQDRLLLCGIDVSPWAVIRRLGLGWLVRVKETSAGIPGAALFTASASKPDPSPRGPLADARDGDRAPLRGTFPTTSSGHTSAHTLSNGGNTRLVDWRDVVLLRGDPRRAARLGDAHPRLASLAAPRLARLAEALPYLHAAELVSVLPTRLGADVFEDLSPERQLQVLGELSAEQAAAILAEVSPDHAADVLGRMELRDARLLLERLPRERGQLVTELLRYPASTAGGIMTNEMVVVPARLTVADVIEEIRPQIGRPDVVYYVYVVDDLTSRRLRGIITLRDLLLARPDQPVSEVMNRRLVTADPLEPAAEVAYRLSDYELNALPVVDADGRLRGIVTIDNAIAQIAPETIRRDLPRVFS